MLTSCHCSRCLCLGLWQPQLWDSAPPHLQAQQQTASEQALNASRRMG